MRQVNETNDVIYTFRSPTELRVWLVERGGTLLEITERVHRTYLKTMADRYIRANQPDPGEVREAR